MTGWWMLDDSQCLSRCSTENKLPLLLGIEYQSSYEHPGHIFIALPFLGPVLIALSCIVSYQFKSIMPVAGHY